MTFLERLLGPARKSFVDKRDGHQYSTIRIGGQVWMAENLAYIPRVSPCHEQGGIWVYGHETEDVDCARATDEYRRFGCLYDHKTALSLCPRGWCLPTRADFERLLDAAGGSTYEQRWRTYTALREGGDLLFNAGLGGSRKVLDSSRCGNSFVIGPSPEFSGIDCYGDWWASDAGEYRHGLHPGKTVAPTLHVQPEEGGHFFVDAAPLEYGLSVRCIKK